MRQMPWRASVAILVLLSTAALNAAQPEVRFLGSLAGVVRTPTGATQLGATVLLLNRNDRQIQRATTNADGRFRFESLTPDYYSIRVTQASYVPATRDRILVKAGLESYLTIQLATFLSTIELVYQVPGQSGLMTDDWKWVLRSSNATRPVLRFSPGDDPTAPRKTRTFAAFSSTRGVVSVSAGDSGGSSVLGSEADLGTAFALATPIFGGNELRVSGNLGYGTAAGVPTAGFRTRYTRGNSASLAPDLELTVRQIQMRQRAMQGLFSGPAVGREAPALRTMSLKVQDKIEIADGILFDYGASMDSTAFLDHINTFSPFGRLTYNLGRHNILQVGYSSGLPPQGMFSTSPNPEAGMQQDLSGLALFPRLTLVNSRPKVQTSDNLELGYHRMSGSRTYSVGVFQEKVHNAAAAVSGTPGIIDVSDLLPDISSSSAIVNLGSYSARGFFTGVNQSLGEKWSAGLAYGEGSALAPTSDLPLEDTTPMRARFRSVMRQWAAARVSGVASATGTQMTLAYVWTPGGTLAPAHAWLTQRYQPAVGLNLHFRQPLPSLGMPGRLEANAELQNLLSQGYVPLTTSDGRQLLLVQFPKSIRGGLSFIF